MWWPEIDKDIEDMIKSCEECQQCRPTPAVAPLHPWKWPTRPCLHIDYAGPLDGKMVLVVIDAHSKWIEAFAMTFHTFGWWKNIQHSGSPSGLSTDRSC